MSADEINFDVIKDTYIGVFKKFLVFEGRARRREFWIFFLVNLVLGLIPGINIIIGLVTCIPSLAVGIRRLHDTTRSGKWILLLLAPVVGLIFMFVGGYAAILSGRGGGIMLAFFVLILLASLGLGIMFLVWAAQDGTSGDNQYGPNPKTSSGAAAKAKPDAPAGRGKSSFCGNCGAKNASGTKFCGSCGKPMA